jgi:hypothetical protein
MIVTIHQPNHLPYLGFFDKIMKSEVFIIHDDCQFNEHEHQHRNKIRIYSGWKWLTVPVYKEKKPIKDIRIRNEKQRNQPHWSKIHYREIRANYKKTPYFDSYKDELKRIYEKKYEKLADLNMHLINFLLKAFDINVDIRYASEFGFTSTKTQKIVDLVNAVGGDVYISGIGGKDYLDLSTIDFKVVFQDFKHPVYPQRYPGFEPNMAAIDALFNVGEFPK